MISQTSEYALRAIVHLAHLGEGPAVAQDISEATKVPLGYLHKILRMLTRAGLLVAQRGVGGGFALARPASEITVLDVLRATETTISRIDHCPLGIAGHTTLCPVHQMLDQAIADAEHTFSGTSVADLLTPERTPLCAAKQKAPIKVTSPPTPGKRPSSS